MTNTQAWDRLASRRGDGDRAPTPCSSAPTCPTEADLRICGDLKGRRVLDIGCGAGENAVAMARQGAHVIAIDVSSAQLALGRRLADASEVAGRVARGRRRRSRVPPRRLDRPRARRPAWCTRSRTSTVSSARFTACCAPERPFVFSHDHPMRLAVGRDDSEPGGLPLGRLEVRRSYFDPSPIVTTPRRRAAPGVAALDRRRVLGAAPRRLPRRRAPRARDAALVRSRARPLPRPCSGGPAKKACNRSD